MRKTLVPLLALLAQAALAFTPTEDGLYAVFDTNKGEIAVRLDFKLVPMTVANFVGLAEGTIPRYDATTQKIVTGPFYDGLTFHAVQKNNIALGGSPGGAIDGGPGYEFSDEMHPVLSLMPKGTLAYYNPSQNRNGSQFFLTLAENALPGYDGEFPVFGLVVDGLANLDAINNVAVDAQLKPTSPVVINSVKILRVGEDAQKFNANDYPLPRLEPLPIEIDPNSLVASFQLPAGAKSLVATSSDLSNWVQETATPTVTTPRSIDLKPSAGANDPRFISAAEHVTPASLRSMAGYTFSAKLKPLAVPQEADWIYKLDKPDIANEGGQLTINNSSGTINSYRWYDQGPRKALLQTTTSNLYIIRYFLFFTDDTKGNYYAQVADYAFNPGSTTPQRYVLSGPFTLTAP